MNLLQRLMELRADLAAVGHTAAAEHIDNAAKVVAEGAKAALIELEEKASGECHDLIARIKHAL